MSSILEHLSKTIEEQIEKLKPFIEKIGMKLSKYQSIDEEKCEVILGIKITFKDSETFKKFIGK